MAASGAHCRERGKRAAAASVERFDRRRAHQRLEQPGERPQRRVARRDLVRIGEEARQVLAVRRLAVAVLQAREDAEHLQVALQADPFEVAPELAEVGVAPAARPCAPPASSGPPSRAPAPRPTR